MRITPALLCFSLIFSATAVAGSPPQSALDTYISARDQALGMIKAKPGSDERALADLERLIKLVIPPWSAPGFSAEGRLTLTALDEGDVGFGALDGLEYSRSGTIVVVTTKPLAARWLADHRNWWEEKAKNIPAAMITAFRSEAFYTQALANDAAVFLHGLVLVKAGGADLAVVELAAIAQDLVMDRGPDTMLAVVMRGDRIFLAQEKLNEKLAPVAVCKAALDKSLAHAKTEKDAAKEALTERADRDYRSCFAQHLMEQKNYTALQKQAQALVDELH